MEFMSQGEKITAIRKLLKLKQGDFETKKFTRGYMALIESGKRNLSKNASAIVVNRVRERIKELDMDLVIDDNYFLRTPAEDAKVYCMNMLEKQLSNDELIKLLELCDQYNIEELRANIFCEMGKICCEEKDFSMATIQLVKAATFMDKNTPLNIRGEIFYWMAVSMEGKNDYSGASELYKMAYTVFTELKDVENIKKLSYATIKAIFNSGKYSETVDVINQCMETTKEFLNDERYMEVLEIKAKCYENMGDNVEAAKIYNDIGEFVKYGGNKFQQLKELDDRLSIEQKNRLGHIYERLSCQLRKSGNITKAFDYINEAEELKRKGDISSLSHTLYEKGKLFELAEIYDKAISFAKEGEEIAEKYNDEDYIIKNNKLLYTCYVKLENMDAALQTLERILKIYKDNKNVEKAVKVLIKLRNIYLEKKDENIASIWQNNIDKLLMDI